MFCPQCGKENQGSSAFCIYCGNRLPVSGSASDAEVAFDSDPQVAVKHSDLYMTSDSYRNLGGWLAVIAYGRLVSVVLELIAGFVVIASSVCFDFRGNSKIFIGLANFARAAASTQNTFYAVLCYGGLFILLLYIFHACACIGMYRKVRHRKANCIGFYRVSAVLISCATAASLVAGFFLIKQNPYVLFPSRSPYMMQITPIAVIAACLLLDTIISLLVFNAYFKTSIRAKTYFGT